MEEIQLKHHFSCSKVYYLLQMKYKQTRLNTFYILFLIITNTLVLSSLSNVQVSSSLFHFRHLSLHFRLALADRHGLRFLYDFAL